MMKHLIAAVVLAAGIAVGTTATAAEWNFYGSARVATFWADDDDGTGSSDTQYSETLQSNARIGAKVKVSDALIGRFEYGAKEETANIRHLFGEWSFGSGKLLVGQTDSLMKFSISNQVYGDDANMKKFGKVDAGRRPMIRLSFGDFQVAAIQPSTEDLDTGGDTKTIFPKFEAKYRFSSDSFFVEAVGGYQTYELMVGSTEYDIDSYVLALGGQFNFGPAYIGADGWFGQNVGPYGLAIQTDADPGTGAGSDTLDNDAYGVMGVLGYAINDMFALEAGVGYVCSEVDNATDEDNAIAYYIQATITLAKGVSIVPEIGFLDDMDDMSGVDEGDELYYGMKWQINF